jgi:hypothetical protein
MSQLISSFTHLAFLAQDAVHRPRRAKVGSFVKQGGIDSGRRFIHEPLLVEDLDNLPAFLVAQSTHRLRPGLTGPKWTLSLTESAIEGRPRHFH